MTFERHFLDQGCFMATPRFDLHKTDFVLEWQGRLVKVQVKTMSPGPGNSYVTCIGTNRKGCSSPQPYSSSEIDYFGVVNLHYGHIWMIPVEDTSDKVSLAWIPPDLRKRKKHSAFEWDQYLIK